MAKRKAETCPECGGGKRGRGYAHKPSCSLAGKGKASKGGISLAGLKGRSVTELMTYRGQLDRLIASKAGELKAEIAKLQETLKAIDVIYHLKCRQRLSLQNQPG